MEALKHSSPQKKTVKAPNETKTKPPSPATIPSLSYTRSLKPLHATPSLLVQRGGQAAEEGKPPVIVGCPVLLISGCECSVEGRE